VTPQNRFLLTEIPAGYQMPLLDWFRGLTLDVGRVDAEDALVLHTELDMTHLDVAPAAEDNEDGGFFSNLLGGWGGAQKEQAAPSNETAPE